MTTNNLPQVPIIGLNMPLGIIDQVTPRGAIFVFTRPDDSATVPHGASVTLWDYDQRTGALARYRGRISEVGNTVGAFIIEDTDIDPHWPNHLEPIQPGNCVYLAKPGSYEPDPHRVASRWEMEQLAAMAEQFERSSGITTSIRIDAPVSITNTNIDPVLE